MSTSLLRKGSAQKLLRICSLGQKLVPYEQALQWQEALAKACKEGGTPDTLLQLQHSPVYTIGKRGRQEDFRKSQLELEKLGADIFTAARGGETTFHGPGQVVMYPIVNLRRLGIGARAYVEGLEDTIIAALQEWGVQAQGRQPSRTGVWVGDEKIAAIGVQISGGVARHGLALNVSTDLSYFDHIVPCGLPDFKVTSLQALIGKSDLPGCSQQLQRAFVKQFLYDEVECIKPNQLLK